MLCRCPVLATTDASICLSVCPSLTFCSSIKKTQAKIDICTAWQFQKRLCLRVANSIMIRRQYETSCSPNGSYKADTELLVESNHYESCDCDCDIDCRGGYTCYNQTRSSCVICCTFLAVS